MTNDLARHVFRSVSVVGLVAATLGYARDAVADYDLYDQDTGAMSTFEGSGPAGSILREDLDTAFGPAPPPPPAPEPYYYYYEPPCYDEGYGC